MHRLGTTYKIPAEILTDLNGMTDSDRSDLIQVWSMLSEKEGAPSNNGRDRVRAAVFAEVEASLKTSRPAIQLPKPVARIYSMRMRMVSVAAALVLGLSFVLSPSNDSYRVGMGSGTMTVSLSDGSSVTLAPGSRLIVPENFGIDNRKVRLVEGQAFFDVKAGAIPFEVKTFDANTTVLGTSFSVKSWTGQASAQTEVAVTTGRVSVDAQNNQVLLTPGEITQIDVDHKVASAPAVKDVSALNYWMSGGFYFDHDLVGNVVKEIERRFDVSIKSPASINLRAFSYSKAKAESADEVLGDLAATIGVRFRPTANGFELYLQ